MTTTHATLAEIARSLVVQRLRDAEQARLRRLTRRTSSRRPRPAMPWR